MDLNSPIPASPAPAATRVLVIGYVWPEPRSSAAGGHMMQLIGCFLGQGWQVTFASPAAVGEHKADLRALGVDEQPIELNSGSFDVFARQLDPDIVLFDRFMMEEQFGWRIARCCPNALRVLETSDLHSLRDARQQLLKEYLKRDGGAGDCSGLFAVTQRALFQRMSVSDIAQREMAAIYRSDISLMISDFEIDLLTVHFGVPEALLQHCPLMPDRHPERVNSFDQREHFISIGNFRHAPNWDAVLWLKHSIWPLIRQHLPTAQLHVHGAYTPPRATALHNPGQGFHIRGWAEDALSVMEAARVCLAPLRFGAGIKGKIADAMFCGTPNVTTPIGAESMSGGLPWPGTVAGNAAEIAEAAVRLYQDKTLWYAAQERGREILAVRYRRETIAAALIARLDAIRQGLGQHRIDNFTGAMLRHHQHDSTRYKSQWIEAKNRS